MLPHSATAFFFCFSIDIYVFSLCLFLLDSNAEDNRDMAQYVKTTEKALRAAFKIDEKIYFERNTSTNRKRVILRQLFELYDLDPSDLVFYLKPQDETVES